MCLIVGFVSITLQLDVHQVVASSMASVIIQTNACKYTIKIKQPYFFIDKIS